MAGRLRAALFALVVVATLGGCGTRLSPETGVPTDRRAAATAPAGSAALPTLVPSTAGPAATAPAAGSWARLQVDGPAPVAREDHTWTVAEDGHTAYLFGGRDGSTIFDDLWAYDLLDGTWRQLRVQGATPEARFGHEAAWVPPLGLVIWAGQAGSAFFDDLWLFEPSTGAWRALPAAGDAPVARYGSCSGIGPDGRLWISHGFTADGVRFADTKAHDFVSGTWIDQAPARPGPFERCLHACWWTSDGRFALYGGQTTGVPALGDLWFLRAGDGGAPTNQWAEAPDQEAAARQLAAVARRGSLAVMFGGRGLHREALGDTWLLPDGATRLLRFKTGDGPRARSGAAMVYDAAADRILLFGGLAGQALDDLWSLTFD